LRIRDLNVRRGTRSVLSGVNLDLQRGEFAALLGLNGAGKSTLLETLARVVPEYGGSCQLDGREVRSLPRRDLSRAISFLPQTPERAPGFTVRQVVAMGRYPYTAGWMESPADTAAIHIAMEACQCAHLSARRLDALSGGERHRALLAAALAQQTPLLALDEPSAHADPPLQAAIFELLAQHAATGTTVVAAVHDLNLALAFATRAIVLHEGRIVYDGSAQGFATSLAFDQVFGTRLSVRQVNGEALITYTRGTR
jgi:iron complex transport system ATP-binding protein